MTNLEKAIKYAKLALNEETNELNIEYLKASIIGMEECRPLEKNTDYKALGIGIKEIIERQEIGNNYFKDNTNTAIK